MLIAHLINMRNLLLLLMSLNLLHSATLFGDIYEGDSFSHLNNTRVKIEGTVTLQFISNQNYSVDVPFGTYNLTATYFKDGKIEYYTEEKITVNQELMRYDLVLLPYELIRFNPPENDSDVVQPPVPQPPSLPPTTQDNTLLIALTAAVVLIVIYLFYKQLSDKKPEAVSKKPEETEEAEEEQIEEEYTLDEESRKILEILKSSGGRMLQKQLREILGASQSNMSLVLTELEQVGYIKRFKRGRENLLKLVKEPPSS